ncbi:MAG: serine hydrolase [Pirellulales bacterium]
MSVVRACALSLALSLFHFATYSAVAQDKPAPAVAPPFDAKLAAAIEPLIKAHAGDVAVGVRHLKSGAHFEVREHEPMSTASLIKLPIMVEAYRQASEQKVDLAQSIEVTKEDMVPGSGILTTHFSPGTKLSLRDAIHLMIAFSDNTATNLVLDKVSMPAVNETMKSWGHPETQIHSKVYKRETSVAPQRSERFGLGSTTAHDMIELLADIYAEKSVSAEASRAMLGHLAACDDKWKFPALLPGTKIFHKTGSVGKIRTDAGIIETKSGPVALCVLTENNKDMRWSADNDGDRLCAEIAKAVVDHFNSTAPSKDAGTVEGPKTNTLANGSTGDLVEALQRTLNARSPAKPNLSVDGDFGSGTEKAVREFQKAKELPVTGIVDRATWDALGPLLMEAAPVPDPELVNNESLKLDPPDDPFAPPQVTCKAWIVADAASGKTIGQHDAAKPLDIASTTKIMTALLVMEFCRDHPSALDEIVTFSERADKTPGSTSGLRTGEQVSVRELLYGLMLPSGNDASVAFAEHFGSRLGHPSDSADTAPYDRFIAAMNRKATELAMSDSRFINPHGLTAEGHRSTAQDLVKLAIAARRLPLFREVTATRQHGCKVTSTDGYSRNVKWENTNQLLPIAGYSGMKTGTTDAAGACLVSVGSRGDRELIVVVLGSTTSPLRYMDSRNLYAWGWRKLEADK